MPDWVSRLFFVPAVFGGIFGLLGGYFTDRFGRRRVLTWSILCYAFSAFGAGYATNIQWLLALRCTTFIGVCVEFVAATAWLAELFSDRARALGYTQAFGSVGGLLVTFVYGWSVTHVNSLPAIHGEHAAWRYTLISGLIPAIPLIIIRPFLPESPIWREKKAAGTPAAEHHGTLRPAIRSDHHRHDADVRVQLGAAFGAIQHMPRIVPGIEEVRLLLPPAREQVVKDVQLFQEVGGLIGRVVLAILAVRIISRRPLLWVFQVPGLIIVVPVSFSSPPIDRSIGRMGHPARWFVYRRAIQLLGIVGESIQPISRHRGKLRGKRGRPDDRAWRLGDAGLDDARRESGAAAGSHRGCRGAVRLRGRLPDQLFPAGTQARWPARVADNVSINRALGRPRAMREVGRIRSPGDTRPWVRIILPSPSVD